MAQKVNIVLVDDIDGSDATETVSFGLDGTSYEIDLNDGNAERLRGMLSLYISHGRRTGGRRQKSPTGTGRSRTQQLGEVRAWARAHGHSVSDRGRMPQAVLVAYSESNA